MESAATEEAPAGDSAWRRGVSKWLWMQTYRHRGGQIFAKERKKEMNRFCR